MLRKLFKPILTISTISFVICKLNNTNNTKKSSEYTFSNNLKNDKMIECIQCPKNKNELTNEIENKLNLSTMISFYSIFNNDGYLELLDNSFDIYDLYLIYKFNINGIGKEALHLIKYKINKLDKSNLKHTLQLNFLFNVDVKQINIKFLRNTDQNYLYWYVDNFYFNKFVYNNDFFTELIDSIIFNKEYTLTQNEQLYKFSINHNNGIISLDAGKNGFLQFKITNIKDIIENLLIIMYIIECNNFTELNWKLN